MKIESSINSRSAALDRKNKAENPPLAGAAVGDETATPIEDAVTVQIRSEEGEDSTGERGVIRNLLDGKFKGVADVRLRINFYDELQGLERQQDTQSIRANAQSLLEGFDDAVGEFTASNDLPEELSQSLNTSVSDFRETLTDLVSDPSKVSSFKTSYESFLTDLRGLLQPPAPEIESVTETGLGELGTSSVESSGATETSGETPLSEAEPSASDLFLTSLSGLLSDSLAAFDEVASTNTLLPELTKPSGSGRAYDKFLAIYQSLSNSAVAPESPTPSEGINLAA